MVNRVIIRIKVLQIIYAYYLKGNNDLLQAENELMMSLQKAHDLYHYLLLLIPLLTDVEQKRLDIRKHKYLASEKDKNPNTRFIDNRLASQLSNNKSLLNFANEKGYLWDEDATLLKTLLNTILSLDIYQEYLDSKDNYASDKEFWRIIFKQVIINNEHIAEFLEERNIFWNDDIDIIGTFALKSIKRMQESSPRDIALLPMFKDDEDKEFAVNLLRYAIQEADNCDTRVSKHIHNWDIERIATIDMYIMQLALAEILHFDSIPVSVSLNEYIDMAKYYSSPKSGIFINGILDVIVSDLKKEKLLFKNE